MSSQPTEKFVNPHLSDGKNTRAVMQRAANDVDQVKRLSFANHTDIYVWAQPSMQRTNCDKIFAGGSLLQIHLRTITLLATRTMRELRHGSSREASSRNGSPRVHFFGSMVNVRSSTVSPLVRSDGIIFSKPDQ